MKSTLDCVPCFVEHALHVAKMTTDDEAKQFDILCKTLAEVSKMELEQTPPEMARTIHSIIRQVTGVDDPYRELKDKSTEFALKLLPLIREDIKKAGNSFEAIVRMVIAGNIIDFGADRNFKLEQAHDKILSAQSSPIDSHAVEILRRAMDRASRILYIADNCGEAVLDKLLIELYKDKITLAVRGYPILNDITRREISMSGLDSFPRIIDTGDATPGVSLRYSSPDFLEEMNSTDLIVAKGQGNYETLSDTERPIVFLFRVKCKVLATMFEHSEKGKLYVLPKNIDIN